MKNKLSIIIVHWNTPKSLKTLIDHLNESKHKVDIIVIDNNSTPHPEWLKKLKNVSLIQNNVNRGYATACNQGVSQARGDWLLFLNPDINLGLADAEKMVDIAEKKRYDAASIRPISTNYSKPLPSLLSLLVEFSPLHRFVPLSLFKKRSLFGGGLLIKKQVLMHIGGWDERFFVFFEDADLTRKLLDNDFCIGWIEISHVHQGGLSFKKLTNKEQAKLYFESMQKYADKHMSFLSKILVFFIKQRFT